MVYVRLQALKLSHFCVETKEKLKSFFVFLEWNTERYEEEDEEKGQGSEWG